MTRDPLYILAVLCLVVVASEWLARHTVLRHLGTALLVILVTAVLANIGLLPAGSPPESPVAVYDGVFAWIAPLAIFWLVLPVRLAELRKAGGPMIVLFLAGAGGVVLGAMAGGWLLGGEAALGEHYRAVGGMFVGTYVGGSINFNAVALDYGVVRDGALYAGTVAVDNVITTLWMVATLALPRLLHVGQMAARVGAPSPVRAPADDGVATDTESLHPVDVALVLAVGLTAVLLSNRLASMLAAGGHAVPAVLILTTLALVLAQLPWATRLRGVRVLGMLAVYLFLAVIGAFCDLRELAGLGTLGLRLLAFASVLVAVHGVVTFGAARLLRLDPDVAAVASQANVGGSTSALALARSLGRGDLVVPGVLVGALGNALGTFLGFWAAGRLL